jgi:uncharacterized protein YjbI with pentapeptide repeats
MVKSEKNKVARSASPESYLGLPRWFVFKVDDSPKLQWRADFCYKKVEAADNSAESLNLARSQEGFVTYFHATDEDDAQKKLEEIARFNRKINNPLIYRKDGTLAGSFIKLNDSTELFDLDFSRMNLKGVNFSGSSIYNCSFEGANLEETDFSQTCLVNCNFIKANLKSANFQYSTIRNGHFRSANMQEVNLRSVTICGGSSFSKTNFQKASFFKAEIRDPEVLQGAILPDFQIPQGVELTVWKKLRNGVLAKLLIPADAKRTASLIGNKCRAERAVVLELISSSTYGCSRELEPDYIGVSIHDSSFYYQAGETVHPRDPYNDSFTEECRSGIHFFMERTRAEDYL